MKVEDLKPKERLRIMDLVSEAGIDVSDWANFKGGEGKAASNPKYCYEWSYENTNKSIIVLNLWYEDIKFLNGSIIQSLNMRKVAQDVTTSPQSRRAIKMDFSLQKAARLNWPLRVIICDGVQHEQTTGRVKSTAETRLLDSELWYVQSYDSDSGDCLLIRSQPEPRYVDQFQHLELPEGEGKRKEVTGMIFQRDPKIRNYVLTRARGVCEWCGAKGFETRSGSIYLETHHIQPLSEGGSDAITNVIALCPNHHREAHFGNKADDLRNDFLKCIMKASTQM